MSSLVNSLLSMDKGKITDLPKDKIELPRLSEINGEKFEIVIQAISNKVFQDIQNRCNKIKKKGNLDFDLPLYQSLVLTKGIIDPDLTNPELLAHFGCNSSRELVDSIFLAGEKGILVEAITNLMAGDEIKEQTEEIKKH